MCEVMEALSGRQDLRAWRNNVGAAKDGGREIEVKGPRGRLAEKQKNFGAMIEKFGGVYGVVSSAAEASELLETAKKKRGPRAAP